MKIYDFMHAYQPFFDENMPQWVITNLKEVFIPLSKALAQGQAKHTIQIQGWTLDSWAENEKTKALFQEFIKNIRKAVEKENVQLAFSAYSHPILPLLSNNLIEMQIEHDYNSIIKYLGEPKFFFPPEGAIDQRTLNVIYDLYPDITILIPDRCLGQETVSGFYSYKGQNLAVFPVIIKDALMGAPYFKKPPAFIPEEVDWENAKKAFRSGKSLKKFFKEMGLSDVIIARDMENAESRNALKEYCDGSKELPALVQSKQELKFLDDVIYNKKINKILSASWEPLSNEEDPFPFWAPRGEYFTFLTQVQKELINGWLDLVRLYDHIIINNKTLFKETSPIIISCFPWHFTTPIEWDNNIGFSQYILDYCIKTRFPKLIDNDTDAKEYAKIISSLDKNLKKLQDLKRRIY